VADVVTTRQASLHNELIDLLRLDEGFRQGAEASLAILAYRPTRRGSEDQGEAWAVPLQLAGPMPVLPLAFRGATTVPLDLERTYMETRQRCQL
jgi:hypothetical protein